MIKYIVVVLIFVSQLFSWSLFGSKGDIGLDSLNLSSTNIIWVYNDGVWYCNKDIKGAEKLTTIKGGEGFWVKDDIDTISSNASDTYIWHEGWNLISPVFEDWNLNDRFKDKVPYAWRYKDGKWYLYSQIFDYQNMFDTLKIGEGAWVYLPSIDMYFGNQPILCKDGECYKITTSDKSFLMKLKVKPSDKDLHIAFDLYRYSNKTHYKFAFGPFKVLEQEYLSPSTIPVCVEKEGTSSCSNVDPKEKFAYYKDGYLFIDSQKIASLFDKSIPDTKEKFNLKLYIEGFSIEGFKDSEDFGTIGIENFGTWVTVKDDQAVDFDLDIR